MFNDVEVSPNSFVPPDWLALIYDFYEHFDGLILFILGFAAAQIVAGLARRRERTDRTSSDARADAARRRDLARGKADEVSTAAESLDRELSVGARALKPGEFWVQLPEAALADVRDPLRYLADEDLRRNVSDALGQILQPMVLIDWAGSTSTPIELQRQASEAIVEAVAAYVREDQDHKSSVRLSNIAARYRGARNDQWADIDAGIASHTLKTE